MMSRARILAAKMVNAWKRYEAELDGVRPETHMVIRLANLPPREAGTEKVRAIISHGYKPDDHEPELVIECERDFPGSYDRDRPKIRLSEAEAVDLGRFIRKNFGE